MAALSGIGDFSRMTFLSTRSLHHCPEIGLLEPVEVDPETGSRHYAPGQLAAARGGRWRVLHNEGSTGPAR